MSKTPKEATHAKLGRLIRQRRELNDLSMPQLASAAQTSESFISRLERGIPGVPRANKLARVLRVLDFTQEEVEPFIPGEIRESTLWQMSVVGDELLRSYLNKGKPPGPPVSRPVAGADVVLVAPNGARAAVVFEEAAGGVEDARVSLGEALKGAGWTVLLPV